MKTKTEIELEERLKKLEEEQSRQEFELRDLEEITRLENSLSENEPLTVTQSATATHEKIGKDVERLEHDLETINQVALAEMPRPLAQKKTSDPFVFDDSAFTLELPETQENKGAETGYIICLLFNQNKPTEWAEEGGGGWREAGKGFCYATIAQAKIRLDALRAKWPDYPIEMRKRI
ncbi:hypothetical protein BegalDRAFT_0567 [Beggiatoa alba B18LD]|uniref:Uncharacterized protein n=2 Tax=Beggiatoa alba TaxID=1022 RepID=I3CCZ2_9GAMM|nr:hypothetical protein BegalDRAFT_0567 [Beggiatoa alba B18LD]